ELLTLLGEDIGGKAVHEMLRENEIKTDFLISNLKETPEAVILYDDNGDRQIHVDLKDIQESSYPSKKFEDALDECDIAMMCNIKYNVPFLKMAKEKNKIIITDVHVLSDINDSYNRPFMEYADILFLSNEGILGKEMEMAKKLINKYDNKIIVIGMGKKGALLYVKEDNYIKIHSPKFIRKVVNTIGAGDALVSAFTHYYAKTRDPYKSIEMAQLFASYKIGEKGAASGFLTEEELEKLI
ncbi:MAG: carbohydrate kinase family protein, partial [Fusobacteriota bacterium]